MSRNRAASLLGDAYSVIRRPILTEKTHDQIAVGQKPGKEKQARYTFEVHPKATKPQIRKAIEVAFGVKVLSVNTIITMPKRKVFRLRGRGSRPGYRRTVKKAVIRLAPGSKGIELI
jgi:large subunit ribosomal protein L23